MNVAFYRMRMRYLCNNSRFSNFLNIYVLLFLVQYVLSYSFTCSGVHY